MTTLPLRNQQEFEKPEPTRQFHLDRDTKIGLGIMAAILVAVLFLTGRSVENSAGDPGLVDLDKIKKAIEDKRNEAMTRLTGAPVQDATVAANIVTEPVDNTGLADSGTPVLGDPAPQQRPVSTPTGQVAQGNHVIPQAAGVQEYTVAQGDSPATISTKFFGSAAKAQAIMDFNGMKKGDERKMRIGQKLKIPADAAGAIKPAPVTTPRIVTAPTNVVKPNPRAHTTIAAPTTPTRSLNITKYTKSYTVSAYDRGALDVAKKLHISLADLKAANPSVDWVHLPVGTELAYAPAK